MAVVCFVNKSCPPPTVTRRGEQQTNLCSQPPFRHNDITKAEGKQVPNNDKTILIHSQEDHISWENIPNERIPWDMMPKQEIAVLLNEKGPEILEFLQKKQADKRLSNADLMTLSQIPHTSFYRIWNGNGTKMNPDHICRICFVLGVSMDEFQREKTDESTVRLPGLKEDSHEEIMDNILKEFHQQKDVIETLTNDNSRKSDRIVELDRELKRRIDENNELQRKYTERIEHLTDVLVQRHNEMHEIHKQYADRLDKIISTLSQK